MADANLFDGDNLSEEDVRTLVIAPWLKSLGLSLGQTRLEHSFSLRVGHAMVVQRGVDADKKKGRKNTISPRYDLLVRTDGGQNLFIVEVKRPGVELTDDDAAQGISYARLLDEMAPFVVVSNGPDTRVYDTVTRKRIDGESYDAAASALASNGFRVTGIGAEDRYEALRLFLGYDAENLKDFATAQRNVHMAALRGDATDLTKKYLPSTYVARNRVRERLQEFLASDAVVFVISGASGSGKTNEMCAIAEELAGTHLCLFYNGAEHVGVVDAVRDDFNWHFSEELSLQHISRRLERLVNETPGRRVCVFVDAVDEVPGDAAPHDLASLARHWQGFEGRLKLVLSVLEAEWPRFSVFGGNPSPLALATFRPLRDQDEGEGTEEVDRGSAVPRPAQTSPSIVLSRFSREELDAAAALYAAAFHLRAEPAGSLRTACADPFTLRVVSETYSDSVAELPADVDEHELLDAWVAKRMEKVDISRAQVARQLAAVGAALVEAAAREGHGVAQEVDVRAVAERLGGEEPHTALVARGLLQSRAGGSLRTFVRFGNRRLRDLVVANQCEGMPDLSAEDFERRLEGWLRNPVLQSALLWHLRSAPVSQRARMASHVRARGLLFLETYQRIRDQLLPGWEERLEPYAPGPVGLAFGMGDSGLIDYAFYPTHDETLPRLMEFGAEGAGEHALGLAASRVHYEVTSWLTEDPRVAAGRVALEGLRDAVQRGHLDEHLSVRLAQETAYHLATARRDELVAAFEGLRREAQGRELAVPEVFNGELFSGDSFDLAALELAALMSLAFRRLHRDWVLTHRVYRIDDDGLPVEPRAWTADDARDVRARAAAATLQDAVGDFGPPRSWGWQEMLLSAVSALRENGEGRCGPVLATAEQFEAEVADGRGAETLLAYGLALGDGHEGLVFANFSRLRDAMAIARHAPVSIVLECAPTVSALSSLLPLPAPIGAAAHSVRVIVADGGRPPLVDAEVATSSTLDRVCRGDEPFIWQGRELRCLTQSGGALGFLLRPIRAVRYGRFSAPGQGPDAGPIRAAAYDLLMRDVDRLEPEVLLREAGVQ